ncbi:hypothetical protein CP533_1732, partial [Ophiocordyceps camponoti-saundersi (nom. inval.)]
ALSRPPPRDSRRPPSPLPFPISWALRNSNYRIYDGKHPFPTGCWIWGEGEETSSQTIDPPTLSGVPSSSHGPPALCDIRDGQVP